MLSTQLACAPAQPRAAAAPRSTSASPCARAARCIGVRGLGGAVLRLRRCAPRTLQTTTPRAAAAAAAATVRSAASALNRLAGRLRLAGGALRRSGSGFLCVQESAFVPVLSLAELPKGSRKVVSALGKSALLFWYRDALYATEPRSPAEGAYSQGFLTARFTQDGCLECPSTASTFDLKTGEIRAWYPNNPVLRALTPLDTCRPMETFPVRLDGATGVISVDFAGSNLAAAGLDFGASLPTTDGGAQSSFERNNVYGIEPKVYLQDGRAVDDRTGKPKVDAATLVLGTVAIAIVAVAGTAVAISKESIPGLVAFWIALLLPVGIFVFKNAEEGEGPPQ